MEEDRRRWDERYAGHRGGHVATPAEPEALALLDDAARGVLPRRGPALDIACGTGAQSLWLAQRGMDVVALDVSPIAVDLTASAARAHGLDDRIEAQVHDLDNGLPAGARGASIIVCQRFRSRHLYPQIVEALAPGGVAIISVLSAVGVDGTPGPYHAPSGELDAAFATSGVDVLASSEAAGVASIVIRRP